MSSSIHVDQGRATAILMNDEPFFALGPAVAADDPEEAQAIMEAFTDNLEAEPSEMPTIALMSEWQGFLLAFHGTIALPEEIAGDPEAAASVREALAEEAGLAHVEAVKADPSLPDPNTPPSSGDGSTPDGPLAPPPDPAIPDPPAPTAEAAAPLQEGEVECWACGGNGEQPIGPGEMAPCTVCGGSGRLPKAST